ncbi:tripartite tricarboxylate transporter TctB family protein [Halomonas daqingensis]|uniref:Tripartite tricarboxylate transporter TctB family protein n=1 Tax=Billgrantia desiderata TaxID=52021 RepID=A0ABS9BBK6_9GAMM|nr:tripartite tricarboxylate transporter TctB family protein [Halomonas desiderata]MCE8044695.1 tripartite tricarboxylate transporter TctB family protein [Halomonas desiderata]MCE8049269.1 tripartite tricarboxylate transporter TctB family protein [Halomonas desiderata]
MSSSLPKRVMAIRDPGDVLSGCVLLVASLFLLFYLIPNYISEPPIMQSPLMSPRWLPRIVGGLMLLFSCLLIVQGLLVDNTDKEDGRRIEKGPRLRFAMMVAALVVYVTLFEALGAVISGILATLILFAAHPVRTWWVYSLAFVFPAAVAFVFVKVMNVPLPLMPF